MSAISSLRNRRLGDVRPSHLPSQPPASWTPPARLEKKWMVYVEGSEVVGPVSADQIARALKAGMIPMEASVQQQGEVFWDGILDQPAIIAALKSL